ELSCADKWIVVPCPAVFLKQHAHRAILELEACVGEASVLADHRTRTREHGHAVDAPAGDVMRHLGEVPTRGGEPHAERLGFCLCAPFDAPETMAPVADGGTRVRACQELFDEFEWRIGNICRTAWSVSKVVGFVRGHVMTDAMPRRQQRPRTRAMNAPDAVQAPD